MYAYFWCKVCYYALTNPISWKSSCRQNGHRQKLVISFCIGWALSNSSLLGLRRTMATTVHVINFPSYKLSITEHTYDKPFDGENIDG